ncbi:RluA family pseudouridine synthase [Woodsholea maritima]|uniref:RluA family pseudouridine synthase n=1 Tax=Woodsholea maritima TaxID=240237 RepID=UPI0003702DDE|nr:RluA family pseudouridine synthase [Woodsholea maritima]
MTERPIQDTLSETALDTAKGERLDRWMSQTWSALSRARCKSLIEEGFVRCDGEVLTNPSAKIKAHSLYEVWVPAPESAIPVGEDLPLDILYEDDQLIVVNKAAGMAVHPAAGNWSGTLVHGLLYHCKGSLSGIGGVERPGIVHRLDKDTSGVMVVAKTDAAHQHLSAQFAAHSVLRAYRAFVRSSPDPRAGRIETRLGRSPQDRKKMAVLAQSSEAGKHAITNYETLATYGRDPKARLGKSMAALVECRLETGRTHQIRVHMSHIGCPLLGDPVYGRGRSTLLARLDEEQDFRAFNRQALHAYELGFIHPTREEHLHFSTPLPADMQRLQGFLEKL